MVEEIKQDWYFDFLTSDPVHAGEYVIIHGTYGGARDVMFEHFGAHWAFQKDEEYFKKNFPDWMKELKLEDKKGDTER